MALLQVPFQDSELMDGPPRCTEADFEMPRLRKGPVDLATIQWEKRIGEGLDGCVWKVFFGGNGPYILKVVSVIEYVLAITLSPAHSLL